MGKLNIDLGKVLATQGGKQAILVIDDSNIARKTLAKNLEYYGFEIFEARRGGDVTYHGHGQLVGYLVLDLSARGERDLHAYLRSLEELLVAALASLGVPARTLPGYTGVFVGAGEARPGSFPRKLASIGVGVRGWVTWHGFALNVDVQLEAFEAIVPCGLEGVEMTSVERELGADVPADLPARAREAVRASFLSRYG